MWYVHTSLFLPLPLLIHPSHIYYLNLYIINPYTDDIKFNPPCLAPGVQEHSAGPVIVRGSSACSFGWCASSGRQPIGLNRVPARYFVLWKNKMMQYKPRVRSVCHADVLFLSRWTWWVFGLGRGRTGTEAVPPTTLVNAFPPLTFSSLFTPHFSYLLTYLLFLSSLLDDSQGSLYKSKKNFPPPSLLISNSSVSFSYYVLSPNRPRYDPRRRSPFRLAHGLIFSSPRLVKSRHHGHSHFQPFQ